MGEKPDLREKLRRFGPNYLKDSDLAALILGTGTREVPLLSISERVVSILDSCRPENIMERLENLSGVGPGKAAALAAACELGRRYCGYGKKQIEEARDLIPFILHYSDRKQEHFVCVSFSGAHEIIAIRTVSVGLLNKTLVHPREVFADPIADRAAAVIVCHNHPSGNVSPSDEDIETTWRLFEAGEILGIRLLDHIITAADGSYFSFVEHGIPLKKEGDKERAKPSP